MLHARFDERGEALLVTPFARRLDAKLATHFTAVVGERARGRRLVVVSLVHVVAIDASGLASLVAILKRMAPGGTLRLLHVPSAVRTLLEATFLDELFPAFDDADTALRASR
jgi:anti-anti-sigma factor